MNAFKSNHILAMEFKDEQIRFVVGKVNKSKFQMKCHFSVDLLSNVYENGEIKDFHQLSYIIKRNLEINKIKTKNTHILLDSDKIVIREITIPVRLEDDYKEFLEHHLEDFLPINKEEYIVNHQVVDSILSQENTKILVTAAPRTLVNDFHRLITHSGLNPCIFDVIGNSISKFLFHNEEYGLVATIGIDYLSTNIVISNLGQFRYSKRINTGYMKIIEALNDLEIDKYELIEILSQGNSNIKYGGINQIAAVNNTFQKVIFNDIEVVLKYFLGEERVDTIYLYEDYSKTKNIEENFTEYFKCHCKRLNVLEDISFKGDILTYASCIGGLIRI